jgi:hypothetical protein
VSDWIQEVLESDEVELDGRLCTLHHLGLGHFGDATPSDKPPGSQGVHGTLDSSATAVQDVGVDHGCLHIPNAAGLPEVTPRSRGVRSIPASAHLRQRPAAAAHSAGGSPRQNGGVLGLGGHRSSRLSKNTVQLQAEPGSAQRPRPLQRMYSTEVMSSLSPPL